MIEEIGAGMPGANVGAIVKAGEVEFRHGIFRLEKYSRIFTDPLGDTSRDILVPEPYEAMEFLNAYTNTGGAALLDLLMGAGGTAFNNANSYIGVGDSSTANAVSQTDRHYAGAHRSGHGNQSQRH
jgi:hypothetical protein